MNERAAPLSAVVVGAATAYAALAYAVLGLAALGVATSPWTALAAVFAVGLGVATARFFGRGPDQDVARHARLWALLALALALPFAHAWWLPPFKEDDLMYHLWIPRRVARTGALVTDGYSLGAHFPLLFELPLTLIEQMRGAVSVFAPQTAAIFALAYVSLSRLRAAMPTALATLVTAALLATPVVFDLSHAGQVEIYFSVLWLLALAFYERAEAPDAHRAWYAACLFAGLAAATKYYGLLLPAVLAVCELVVRRRPMSVVWRGLLLAAAVAAPFYVKNLLLTGDPVFPFAAKWLPSPLLSEARLANAHAMAAAQNSAAFADLPARLLGLDALGAQDEGPAAPSGPLSVLYLLAICGLGRRPARMAAAAAALAFGVFWATTAPMPRYIWPFLVPLALTGASVVARRWPRALMLVLILAFAQSAYGIWRQGERERIWDKLAGRIDADTFLGERYRGSYALAQAANRSVSADRSRILLLGFFGRAYYFEAPTLAAVYYDSEPLLPAFGAGRDDQAAFWRLAAAEGLTHVAVNWAFVESFHRDDGFNVAGLRALLEQRGESLYGDGPYQLVALRVAQPR